MTLGIRYTPDVSGSQAVVGIVFTSILYIHDVIVGELVLHLSAQEVQLVRDETTDVKVGDDGAIPASCSPLHPEIGITGSMRVCRGELEAAGAAVPLPPPDRICEVLVEDGVAARRFDVDEGGDGNVVDDNVNAGGGALEVQHDALGTRHRGRDDECAGQGVPLPRRPRSGAGAPGDGHPVAHLRLAVGLDDHDRLRAVIAVHVATGIDPVGVARELDLGFELVRVALLEAAGVEELTRPIPRCRPYIRFEGLAAYSLAMDGKTAAIVLPAVEAPLHVAIVNKIVAVTFRGCRFNHIDRREAGAAVPGHVLVDDLHEPRPVLLSSQEEPGLVRSAPGLGHHHVEEPIPPNEGVLVHVQLGHVHVHKVVLEVAVDLDGLGRIGRVGDDELEVVGGTDSADTVEAGAEAEAGAGHGARVRVPPSSLEGRARPVGEEARHAFAVGEYESRLAARECPVLVADCDKVDVAPVPVLVVRRRGVARLEPPVGMPVEGEAAEGCAHVEVSLVLIVDVDRDAPGASRVGLPEVIKIHVLDYRAAGDVRSAPEGVKLNADQRGRAGAVPMIPVIPLGGDGGLIEGRVSGHIGVGDAGGRSAVEVHLTAIVAEESSLEGEVPAVVEEDAAALIPIGFGIGEDGLVFGFVARPRIRLEAVLLVGVHYIIDEGSEGENLGVHVREHVMGGAADVGAHLEPEAAVLGPGGDVALPRVHGVGHPKRGALVVGFGLRRNHIFRRLPLGDGAEVAKEGVIRFRRVFEEITMAECVVGDVVGQRNAVGSV
mmetsp:Transcript_11039/g.32722  ORF Transcript_11039/g.32722 Transcript_11039/m.32722 type:complete len:773 (-) Transcript_11039:957-3275(-)